MTTMFNNDGFLFLRVTNRSKSRRLLKINGWDNGAWQVVMQIWIPARIVYEIGPFPPKRFNDQNNRLHVTTAGGSAIVSAIVLKPTK